MTRAFAFVTVLALVVATTLVSGQQPPDQAPLAPDFRAGVDVVSLNVTVSDSEGRFITDLGQEELLVYEDGVLQETTFFSRRQLPIALALLIDTSASMDERMTTAQEAAIGFSQRLRAEDLAEIIDFDSRVNILQSFTNDLDDLELAIRRTSAGGSTSLYNALYISLRELKKAPLRVEDVRREAIVVLSDGEDTSSLVTFEEVLELAKRSETAIYSIGLKSEDSRSRTGLRASRTSCCASSRRRPAAGRSSPTTWPTSRSSTSRSPTSCRASIRSATSRRTPCGTGAGVGSSCRVDRDGLTGPDQAGLLRPNGRLTHHLQPSVTMVLMPCRCTSTMNIPAPRSLRRPRASPMRCTSHGVSEPRRPRRDRGPRGGSTDAHAFVIGMQTMEVGHIPFVGTTGRGLGVRLSPSPGLPLHRDDDRRACDGRLHRARSWPLLQIIPAVSNGRVRATGGARQPMVRHPRVGAALRVRELRAGVCDRHHVRAALQGAQGQTSWFFYARLPSLQVLDLMNGRAVTVGWVVPHDRTDCRSAMWLVQVQAEYALILACRPCRCSIPRSSSCCGLLGRVLVRAVCETRRSGGVAGVPPCCRPSGFTILLLNFVPIGLLRHPEPQLLLVSCSSRSCMKSRARRPLSQA